jgi:hypothetical protein
MEYLYTDQKEKRKVARKRAYWEVTVMAVTYTIKKGSRVPVSSRDVTNQTPPGQE